MHPVYQDLPDGHIRLLTIHPGDEASALSGIIRSAPLELAPNYEAVSYAWGAEDFTDALDVVCDTGSTSTSSETKDVRSIPITPNVTSLLNSLRYPNEPRVLWIDAICINQANASERSVQVQQMRQIYSRAQRIIIWLGLATEDGESDRAFRFLQRMGTYKKKHDQRPFSDDETSEFSQDESLTLSDLRDPKRGGDSEAVDNDVDAAAGDVDAAEIDVDTAGNDADTVDSYDEVNSHTLLTPVEAAESAELTRSTVIASFSIWFRSWVKKAIELFQSCALRVGLYCGSGRARDKWDEMRKKKWEQHEAMIRGELPRTWTRFLERMKFWERRAQNGTQERARMAWAADINIMEPNVGHVAIGYPVLCDMFGHPLAPFFHESFQTHWTAVDNLLGRQWWSRTWVVQEVWSTSDRAIVQCGKKTIRWKIFQRAMSYHEYWDDIGKTMKDSSDCRVGVWAQLQRRYGLALHLCKMRLLNGKLSDLLWNTWDRDAADPRDKVFAVLGLVGEENRPLMIPDYNKTVKKVFCEAARDIIRTEDSLDILLAAGGSKPACNGGMLPSWVPDWRKEANETRPVLFVNRTRLLSPFFGGSMDYALVFGHGYKACADEKAVAWFGMNLETLHTHAILIDEISSWCGAPQGSGPVSVDSIINNSYTLAQNALEGKTNQWWIKDEKVKDELRPEWMKKRHATELRGIIERVLCAGSAGEKTVAQVVQNIMPLRRFFVTKGERYMGIGPASVKPGDKVFVLAGCNFPLILRDIVDKNGDRNGEFELIGEAYGASMIECW